MISRPQVLCCLLLFLGCDPPALRPINEIKGAEFISFRCVDPTPGDEGLAGGGPLENCGCTKVVEDEGEPNQSGLAESSAHASTPMEERSDMSSPANAAMTAASRQSSMVITSRQRARRGSLRASRWRSNPRLRR